MIDDTFLSRLSDHSSLSQAQGSQMADDFLLEAGGLLFNCRHVGAQALRFNKFYLDFVENQTSFFVCEAAIN